jgi:hypothetical protein
MLIAHSTSRRRNGHIDKKKAASGRVVEDHGEERDGHERAGTGCARHPMPGLFNGKGGLGSPVASGVGEGDGWRAG